MKEKLFLFGLPAIGFVLTALMIYTSIQELAFLALLVFAVWSASLWTALAIYRHSTGNEMKDRDVLKIYQALFSR